MRESSGIQTSFGLILLELEFKILMRKTNPLIISILYYITNIIYHLLHLLIQKFCMILFFTKLFNFLNAIMLIFVTVAHHGNWQGKHLMLTMTVLRQGTNFMVRQKVEQRPK